MEFDFPIIIAMLQTSIVWKYGFIGSVLSGIASAVVGGLLSGSSARSTNASNQAIATQETEFNQASAREANALTEKLAGKAIKSTEGMTANALALSREQFDKSQSFNERMSNTTYTRGIKDLKAAGLNPILAATRGQTSSPTVSGGPTASGSGTSGSGTAARASQFRKVDAGLQALNSAAAIGRVNQEIEAMALANEARRKFGIGSAANIFETASKTATTLKRKIKPIGKAAGGAYKRVFKITSQKLQKEKSALRKAADRAGSARGPRSIYQMFGPPSRGKSRR